MRNDTKLDILWDDVQELKASGGGGGGSDLPDVTEADDGKILGVVNGAWNKMDAPSGAIDYSTTEQNTGRKWIDGSIIYQKTYVFTNELTVSYNSWTTTTIPTGDINNIINTEAFNSSGSNWGAIMATVDSTDYIKLCSTRNAVGVELKYLTLFYTKTPATETKTTKKKTTKNKED